VSCGLSWWLGGVVVEDTRIGLVEWWGSGFWVGDGFVSGRGGVVFGGELDAAGWMKGIDGVDYARDRKDWRQWRVGDGVLEGEGGFGTALPEAGEEHEEETELSEQEGGPDSGLSEHVHRGAGGKDDGAGAEESEEEEDRPGLGEVTPQGSPGGGEGSADAPVGLAVWAQVETKLDGVDLDEIEVETEDGGDKEEDDVAGEDVEEGGASYDVLIDVIGPFALEEREWAKDEGGDQEGEEGDADEAPEIEQTLVKQGAETGWSTGLVDEEGSGYEEEVDEKVKRDGGVAEARSGVPDGALVQV
jgi:hypothetical protein